MSTLVIMRNRIADELTYFTSGAFNLPASVVTGEINAAIKHYESERVPWTEKRDQTVATTASGTRYYTQSASWIEFDTIKLVQSGSYITLKPVTWDDIDYKDVQVSGSTGTPYEYATFAQVLRLYPAPNGTYTLVGSGIKRTATLSADGDTNGWLTHGEELIRHRARGSLLINYIRSPEAAQEMALLGSERAFYSRQEQIAFWALRDKTAGMIVTSRLRPYCI